MKVNPLLYEDEEHTLLRLCKSVNAQKIAEIGCFSGGTTVALASIGNVWAIDHWVSDDDYITFLKNISSLKRIFPIRLRSHLAADLFDDGFFDLVFIDADHSYSHVSQDIKVWLPKVRKGGILCGHDCERRYSEYNEEDRQQIDLHAEDEKTLFTCHPGVVKALYDTFHDDYERPCNRLWVKRV